MISKFVDAVNQMSTWSFMNIKCQGHWLTFIQGHSDSTFSNFFSLETAGPIEAKFYVEPPWNGGISEYKWFMSTDQDSCHVHVLTSPLKPLKSSSLKPKGWWLWNLVCLSTNEDTGLTLTILQQGRNWSFLLAHLSWRLIGELIV